MIKVGIIEDEPEIRRLLRMIVERQEGFQVVSESGDFKSAISDFTKYRPDVAFVDIDLNGDSGLECARIMTEINPKLKVIFATAHSEYMANAFEIYAFDYLVKPFDVERVIKTLARIRDREQGFTQDMRGSGQEHFPNFETGVSGAQENPNGKEKGTAHEDTVAQPEKYSEKLMIKSKDQVTFVDKKEIVLVERNQNSTNIITKEETFRTSVSLGSLEEKLNPADFMRCHKSYIINLSMISKIEPYGRWTYVVKLKGTQETALMTAQNYEEIKKLFG